MYKHYLYRHIRLDKNEPFYIGIGTKIKKYNGVRSEYKRAYGSLPKRRNKIWRDITKKSEYKVEILMESDDYDFIKEKEKEFITLYGRIDKKTGILANMTDGGDGTLNINYNKERALKISKANKGRIKSEEERKKIAKNMSKPVINKYTGQRFESILEAAKYEGVTYSSFSQLIWSGSPNSKYKYEDDSLNMNRMKTGKGTGRCGIRVINIETGQMFDTCKEAAEHEDIELSSFYTALNRKSYFKYKRVKTASER